MAATPDTTNDTGTSEYSSASDGSAAVASAAVSSTDMPAEPSTSVSTAADEGLIQKAEECKRRGNEYYAAEDYREAAKHYWEVGGHAVQQQLLDAKPRWPTMLSHAAALQAVDTCPESATQQRAVYFANLAACHVKLEEWVDAREQASAALRADPSYIKALMRRAIACEKLDNLDQALADAKQVSRAGSKHAANAADRNSNTVQPDLRWCQGLVFSPYTDTLQCTSMTTAQHPAPLQLLAQGGADGQNPSHVGHQSIMTELQSWNTTDACQLHRASELCVAQRVLPCGLQRLTQCLVQKAALCATSSSAAPAVLLHHDMQPRLLQWLVHSAQCNELMATGGKCQHNPLVASCTPATADCCCCCCSACLIACHRCSSSTARTPGLSSR
jgi:hypothetical protein